MKIYRKIIVTLDIDIFFLKFQKRLKEKTNA